MDLDSTGGSAPAAVDAGEATALISAMLSRIAESAGGLSEGVGLAASEVLNTASTYWNSDDAASRGFAMPNRAE